MPHFHPYLLAETQHFHFCCYICLAVLRTVNRKVSYGSNCSFDMRCNEGPMNNVWNGGK